MNKEEKLLMSTMMGTIELIAKRLESIGKAPIIFGADCTRCGKPTGHMSHLTDTPLPPYLRRASTTIIGMMNEPLKTCLACGLTTYRDER